MAYQKIQGLGAVTHLSILPLIDYYAADADLKTEAGVAYLVRADDTAILMDVGLNAKKEHPSPLLQNMASLKVAPEALTHIFISHRHLDHVGGLHEQKFKRFSLSQGECELPAIPALVPVPMTPSGWNKAPIPRMTAQPTVFAPGVASTGVLARDLFLMGMTQEQSLAVNVQGKGIVLIIGCGHPTVERIIERAQTLFEEPLYGIIGGLHFPVHGGRMMIGPFNMQNIVGTEKKPWQGGITEQDVYSAIDAIHKAGPQLVALSAHDSSDWSIARFREAFGSRYRDLAVGASIEV